MGRWQKKLIIVAGVVAFTGFIFVAFKVGGLLLLLVFAEMVDFTSDAKEGPPEELCGVLDIDEHVASVGIYYTTRLAVKNKQQGESLRLEWNDLVTGLEADHSIVDARIRKINHKHVCITGVAFCCGEGATYLRATADPSHECLAGAVLGRIPADYLLLEGYNLCEPAVDSLDRPPGTSPTDSKHPRQIPSGKRNETHTD